VMENDGPDGVFDEGRSDMIQFSPNLTQPYARESPVYPTNIT
jgi:hypothetical protein